MENAESEKGGFETQEFFLTETINAILERIQQSANAAFKKSPQGKNMPDDQLASFSLVIKNNDEKMSNPLKKAVVSQPEETYVEIKLPINFSRNYIIQQANEELGVTINNSDFLPVSEPMKEHLFRVFRVPIARFFPEITPHNLKSSEAKLKADSQEIHKRFGTANDDPALGF